MHLLQFATTNRIHRFDRRLEHLQFGERADGRSPNFVKGVNCCPCFFTLDVMLCEFVQELRYLKSSIFSI